jgi:hypothetical protein
MQDFRDWLELTTRCFEPTVDRNLEDLVAGALRYGLNQPDICPERVQLRKKIVDTDGVAFKAGQQKEVDLLITDDGYLCFDVEIAAKPGDVDEFADKVTLLQHLHPEKQVRGVFITLAPEADVQQRCQELGIELAPAPAKS